MANAIASLAVAVVSDVSDAVRGLGDVSAAAADMGDTVDRATRAAADGAGRLSKVSAGADDLAGKTGKATGALGALAGGLEAVGLEKYAGALSTAGQATDFVSGAGDALNLVMESQILASARARAAAIAQAVAQRAIAAATRVWAATQWVLNAALTANPIGLVVVAVAALIAVVVIAYKKSETFRQIVTAAFEAVKAAAGALKTVISNAFGFVVDTITGLPDRIGALAGKFKQAGKDLIGALVDGLKNAAGVIGGIAGNVWDAVKGLLNAAIDKINAALSFTIHLPGPDLSVNLPDIPHLATGGLVTRPTYALVGEAGPELVIPLSKLGSLGGHTTNNYFTVTGALDPDGVARQIRTLLARADRRRGATI